MTNRLLQTLLRLPLLLTLLLLITWAPARGGTAANVLVLQSYHVGYAWTDEVSQGLRQAFAAAAPTWDIQVKSLYMDTKRINAPDYFNRLVTHYRYLLRNGLGPVDLVVAVDNDALDFLLGPGRDLFGAAPVVFCGVNNFPREIREWHPNLTGVEEDVSLAETLALMQRLHPGFRSLYVIHDRTTTGINLRHQVDMLQATQPLGIAIRYPTAFDLPSILKEVATLPEDTLILFTDFNRDGDRYLDYREVLRQLQAVFPRPIYGLWDFQVGAGVVGGRVVSGVNQGKMAAALALRALAGEAPAAIPLVTESPNLFLFDYNQLRRFDIPLTALPAGSIVRDQPDLKYRRILFGGGAAIIVLTAIVLVLGVNIHRRRLAESRLMQAQHELEDKVRQRTSTLRSVNRQLRWENSERKRVEEEIRQLAYTDGLTGLPNRTLLRDRLDQAIARAARQENTFALLFFDIDHFKQVNDTYGHGIGDRLLTQVARRVETLVRKTDTFARFAGDEFVVLLTDIAGPEPAERCAGLICTAVNAPYQCERVTLTVSTSVGIALYPDDGTDPESLFKHADAAMYVAKRQGRNRYQRYGVSSSSD